MSAEKIKDNPTILRELLAAGLPAFPSNVALHDGATLNAPGMMLRDWFAGQAMSGLCGAFATVSPKPNETQAAADARWCYERADAMLKAREASNA